MITCLQTISAIQPVNHTYFQTISSIQPIGTLQILSLEFVLAFPSKPGNLSFSGLKLWLCGLRQMKRPFATHVHACTPGCFPLNLGQPCDWDLAEKTLRSDCDDEIDASAWTGLVFEESYFWGVFCHGLEARTLDGKISNFFSYYLCSEIVIFYLG
jgi:hypothetical protein